MSYWVWIRCVVCSGAGGRYIKSFLEGQEITTWLRCDACGGYGKLVVGDTNPWIPAPEKETSGEAGDTMSYENYERDEILREDLYQDLADHAIKYVRVICDGEEGDEEVCWIDLVHAVRAVEKARKEAEEFYAPKLPKPERMR